MGGRRAGSAWRKVRSHFSFELGLARRRPPFFLLGYEGARPAASDVGPVPPPCSLCSPPLLFFLLLLIPPLPPSTLVLQSPCSTPSSRECRRSPRPDNTQIC